MANDQPILQLKDIHTYYGNIHALKGVSITIPKGRIVCLIGANGAGKSTTLMTIFGIQPAAADHFGKMLDDMSLGCDRIGRDDIRIGGANGLGRCYGNFNADTFVHRSSSMDSACFGHTATQIPHPLQKRSSHV